MSRKESPSLRGGLYIWGLAAAWTALVILLLGWNFRQLTRKSLECALACACTHFEKDVLQRRWNASHGGVYVPVTKGTPPNPFLAHLPEREVRTPSGRLLTLMNPAYMTRQVYDLAKLSKGVKGHITSLKPLRPENAADAWETAALRAFEQGRAEVSGVVREDGQDYLRLMRPLVTERACLGCHAAQGYKLGDVRGGISITMPLAPFWGTWRHELLANSLGLGLLWLLGLLGICWGGRRLRRSLSRQQQSEKELRRAHGELESRVQERTAELAEANTILKEEIGERQRVEETLRRRIDLEQIISSISTEFVQLAGCEVDAGINRTLERIGEFAGVEYAFVIQFSPAGLASSTHEWCAPGLPSQRAAFQGVPLTTFAWSWEKLKRGESLQVPRLSNLPPEAAPEKETLISLGFQSFMAVPLLRGGEPLGTLGFTSTREEKPWAPEDFALLQVLAEIFVNALTRRQAEAALKESEAKYRLLVSQVPAVVFKGYADWSVDFFDNKIEALTGYSKAEFDARQVKWCEVIHPEDLEAARKVFLEALKTTRSYVREHRIRKKTGEISWVQGRGQIFLDDRGEVDYVSGLLFDISERKQAEEALKEKERFLAGIFNSIQDGLSVIDTDFNILRVNPALAQVYAQARPLAGKKCYQAYRGREEPCPVCPARRTLETGRAAFEVMPKEKDGEIRGWLELYTFPWKDPGSGHLKGVINYIRDITARKQAKEALQESEKKYRLLVSQLPAVVFKGYADWSVDFFDDKIEVMTGFSREDFNSRRVKWCDLIPAEDLDYAKGVFLEALQGNKSYVREHRLRRKDGGIIWVQCRGQIFCDAQGKVEYVSGVSFDITARKQAEEALRRTRDYLEKLFNYANGPIIVWDPTFKIIRFNRAFEHLTGYAADKVIGQKLGVLFPEESREETFLKITQTLRGEYWESVEIPILCNNGDIRLVLWNSANIYADDGQTLVATIAQGQDISARKQAEEDLRASEAKFRMLVEQIPQRIFLKDRHSVYITCNYNYARDLGIEVDAIVGKTDYDFHPRELAEKYRADDQRVMASDTIETFDEKYVSLERDYLVRTTKVPVRGEHGNIVGVFGIFEDITERKQAEEALRQSEKRFKDIAENALEWIWEVDAQGKYTYASPVVEKLLGYTPEEMLNKHFYDLVHPDDREEITRAAFAVFAAKQPFHEFLNRDLHKNGQVVWLSTSGLPVLDEKGDLIGYRGADTDITARKQAEEALQRSEEQLRQAVKMEAIGRLAGGVAHDFNNIMTAIRGHGELLLQNLEAEEPCRGDMAHILQAADRAASLIRQLLAFSRKQVCQPRVLDLNALVENLDKMLKRMIGEDVDLVFVPGPGLGQVRADPGQMEQIIMNLAVNARDAMPRGGKLTLETANVELDGEYAGQHPEVAPGPYVLLAVSDTGGGLDAEAKAHLFEPFFTTKEPGRGTGLGLSTVYGIVKQNQGHISVYSEPGQGATFKVYLPRVEDAGEAAALTAAPRDPGRGWETVLVVEDEDLVRQVVRRMLERNGYQVLEAARGQEALRLSEDHPGPIHLVLTDVVMPGMNGRETATALLARRPEVRVLYMSGHTENAIVHHGVLEMGLAFIQKPFKYEDLMAKVREILEAPSPPRG